MHFQHFIVIAFPQKQKNGTFGPPTREAKFAYQYRAPLKNYMGENHQYEWFCLGKSYGPAGPTKFWKNALQPVPVRRFDFTAQIKTSPLKKKTHFIFIVASPSLIRVTSGPLILTAGFLYRAGAETSLKPSRKILSFPRTILETSQGWIPKPQFWYPPLRFGSQHRVPKHLFFLLFWVSAADFCFSAGRRNFGYFPEVPVTKIRVSAPAPYKHPTVVLLTWG